MACLAAKLSSKNLCFVVSSFLFTLYFSSFRFFFCVLLLFLIFCCCCCFSFYFVYGVRQNATFAFNEHEIMSSSTSPSPARQPQQPLQVLQLALERVFVTPSLPVDGRCNAPFAPWLAVCLRNCIRFNEHYVFN